MKNILFFVSLAFVIILCTEDSSAQKINLGVKGGLNLSDVSSTVSNSVNMFTNTESKTGFNVYLFYDLFNFKYISIQGEAGYTQKGFGEKVIITNELGNQTGSYDLKNKINYIDISILAKLIMRSKTFSPYLIAGPYLGIKAGTDLTTSIDSMAAHYSDQKKVLDDFKSTTFGFKAGFGAEIPLKKIAVIAEARYGMDLTNAYESVQTSIKVKNYLFEFMAGVKF